MLTLLCCGLLPLGQDVPQCLDDELRPDDVELGAGPAVCADDDDSRSSSVCDVPPLCRRRRRRLNKCPTRKLPAPSLHHDAGNVSCIIYYMLCFLVQRTRGGRSSAAIPDVGMRPEIEFR